MTNPNYFNSKKYHPRPSSQQDPNGTSLTSKMHNAFVQDATDIYAQRGFKLIFQHLPTGKTIYTKAFITAYNETFSSDWASETVFGRLDPIHMFKQTTRSATLSFKLVAATHGEAFENM